MEKVKSAFSQYEENHDPFDIRVERLPATGRKDCRYKRRKTIVSIKYVTKNGKKVINFSAIEKVIVIRLTLEGKDCVV